MGKVDMTTSGGFSVKIENDQMEVSMPLRFEKAGPKKVNWRFRKDNSQWRLTGFRFEGLTYKTTQPE